MADLNGSWLGTYWQNSNPTRFEATFVQSGNALSGRILDDSALGESQINGEVIGRSISFSKRYLTRSFQEVKYTGTLSTDGNSINGQWRIGKDQGPWEAHRNSNDLMAEFKARVSKEMLAGAGR